MGGTQVPACPRGFYSHRRGAVGTLPGWQHPMLPPQRLQGQGHPGKWDQEPPIPYSHPLHPPQLPSPSPQHPAPPGSTQHPARLSGQLSAFFFPVVSAGAWGDSGAEHPPRHPACPALPLPTTPSTQHRPGCRAPTAPRHQWDFSPTTFSLFLSLSSFSLWFLFFFFFLFNPICVFL